MKFSFTKMQALGNDFVVIDATKQPFKLSTNQIQKMADRHFGVGFDQLLVIEPSPGPGVDFFYRIFNADGSEVSQCGNGARCIGSFIQQNKLSNKESLTIETKASKMVIKQSSDGDVTVNMGIPEFKPERIPFNTPNQAKNYTLEINDKPYEIGVVSMGNPHAVLQVADIKSAPVATLGKQIESHPRFPERTNVGFMQIVSPSQIKLRVYERGTGETLACGSGACAAVAVGIINGMLENNVTVELPGGKLSIHWQGPGQPLWKKGPADSVFTGVYLSI